MKEARRKLQGIMSRNRLIMKRKDLFMVEMGISFKAEGHEMVKS